MITKTTTFDAPASPRLSVGARVAVAVVAFLAAIGLGIAVLPDSVFERTAVDVTEPAIVDYALRHRPVQESSASRLDDYALRHPAIVTSSSSESTPDYLSRYLTRHMDD